MTDPMPMPDHALWLAEAILALAASGKPIALTDVIAAGDALEHAIFNREEILSGMALLIGKGWVVLSDSHAVPCPALVEILDAERRSHGKRGREATRARVRALWKSNAIAGFSERQRGESLARLDQWASPSRYEDAVRKWQSRWAAGEG